MKLARLRRPGSPDSCVWRPGHEAEGTTWAAVPRGHGRLRGAAMTAAPSWGRPDEPEPPQPERSHHAAHRL